MCLTLSIQSGFSMLLDDFYTADLQNTITPIEPNQTSSGISVLSDFNFSTEPLLDRHTLDLIVQLANEVCLFKEVLNADDVAGRYAKDTLLTVASKNNTRLVLLLDKLASHDVISYNWQSVIARKRLIISSSGKKHLTQHDMSSTLNRIKDTTPNVADKQFLATIDKYIVLIKSREV